MSLRPAKKIRFNTGLNVKQKKLPIIGNTGILGKNLKVFDEVSTITLNSGTGITDSGLDTKKAYKSTSCRKLDLAASADTAVVTWTPASEVDVFTVSEEQHNYSKIKYTGKYKVGGYKNMFALILNLGHAYGSAASTPSEVTIKCYSGTKLATLTTAISLESTTAYLRKTYQSFMDDTYFTYSEEFVDDSWDHITKIELEVTGADEALELYIHNISVAFPKYAADVTDAYYSLAMTDANTFFVSQLFGSDDNAGARTTPVKSIEKAWALLSAAAADFKYICIMDSETYKPIALDYTYIGLKQIMTKDTYIYADYLETPKISAIPGVCNKDRVAARVDYRTFYEAGTYSSVGVLGSYLTIGAAIADGKTLLEIIDSNVYNESVTAASELHIRAAEGCVPIWRNTVGDTVLDMADQVVTVSGIIFQGNSAATDKTIISSAAGKQKLIDCTFKNIGASTGGAYGIYATLAHADAILSIENSMFIDNGEKFTAINFVAGSYGKAVIDNCIAYMGYTTDNYFVKGAKAAGTDLVVQCSRNKILGSKLDIKNYAAYFADTTAPAGTTYLYFMFNDTNSCIWINEWNTSKIGGRIEGNYFHDNVRATGVTSMHLIALWTKTTTMVVENNLFNNIKLPTISSNYETQGAAVAAITGSGISVRYNIFSNCLTGMWTYTGNNPNFNLFVKCTVGVVGGGRIPEGCTFLDCTYGIYKETGTSAMVALNCLYYNSPAGGNDASYDTNTCVNADPKLIDIENLNFGWYPDSPIENNYNYFGQYSSNFIKMPESDFTVYFGFLEFEGFKKTTNFTTSGGYAGNISLSYCYIYNFMFGLNITTTGLMLVTNTLIKNNAISCRYGGTNMQQVPTLVYSVLDENTTGILLKSGININYCTIINGSYGLYAKHTGYYNLKYSDYMDSYITVRNSILINNSEYDYYMMLKTDYCLIERRYYDSLATINEDYMDTVGEHDVDYLVDITDSYFPAHKCTGYNKISPAYNAASTASQNIGAMYLNYFETVMTYTECSFVDNPTTEPETLRPINQESSISVGIEYVSNQDGFATVKRMNWSDDALITEEMKQQLFEIFKTSWLLLITTDGSEDWEVWKSMKDSEFSIQQYKYNDTTLPYVSCNLEIIRVDDFNFNDYFINTLWS